MSKQQFITAGLVTILLISIGGYVWYGKKNAQLKPITNQVTKTIPTNSIQVVQSSSSAPITVDGITYITKTYFGNDKKVYGIAGVGYIQVTSGPTREVMGKINTALKSFETQACFPDPEESSSLDDIRSLYKDAAQYNNYNNNATTSDDTIDKMSYEEVRQTIIGEFLFKEVNSQEILFLDKNILSLKGFYSESCGAPHPNDYMYSLSFNLQTGDSLSFKDFFNNYEKDKKKIDKIVYTYLQNSADADADNHNQCNYEEPSSNYIDGGFSKNGISIISLGLGYMGRPCEPNGVIIPFSLLKPYLNTTASFMKSANLEAK